MSLRLVTPPQEEPISLLQARLQLRVDDDDTTEDDLIQRLIITAREEAEHITGRAFLPQTWELGLEGFCEEISLPRPKIISIKSFSYVDLAGVTQDVLSDQYILDDFSEPAKLTSAFGVCWPRARRQANSVRILYSAGFDDADSVPASIKDWMFLRIATLYENRETVIAGRAVELGLANGLLDRWITWGA